MCPICWTTALASLSMLVIVSALATVGSDAWSLLGILCLATLTGLHRASIVASAWWIFALLIALVTIRVVWIMTRQPQRILAVQLWKRSQLVAKRRCPRSNS